MIDYSKYFGITDFINDPVKVCIESRGTLFYEDQGITKIHFANNGNLFEKYGIFYSVENNNDLRLIENKKIIPIKDSFNFKLEIIKDIKSEEKQQNINNINFKFVIKTADCKLYLNSIVQLSNINSWDPQTELVKDEVYEYPEHTFISFRINELPDLSGIRNLLLQFFENQILGINESLAIILSEDKHEIIIFPKVQDSGSYIEGFTPVIDLFISFLKNYTFDQFYNCICEDGCYNCLFDTRFQSRKINESNLSKNEIFKLISKLNNEDGINDLIKVRSYKNKIKTDTLNEILIRWKKIILEIFKIRFSIKISDPYKIIQDKLEEELWGQCNHQEKIISINKSLSPLHKIVLVIAHEFTHNWQQEKMNDKLRNKDILFGGKLFVEGFAQWVAFRIMDFFGLHSNLQSITLEGVDSKNPNEYGLGFRVCKHIEENYGGFYGVCNFMQKGYAISNDGKTEINYDEIIKNSGIETYIKDKNNVTNKN